MARSRSPSIPRFDPGERQRLADLWLERRERLIDDAVDEIVDAALRVEAERNRSDRLHDLRMRQRKKAVQVRALLLADLVNRTSPSDHDLEMTRRIQKLRSDGS